MAVAVAVPAATAVAVASAAAEAVTTAARQAVANETAGVTAADLAAIVAQVRLHADAIDAGFVTLTGILVLSMQTGFAMLTAGSVRAKNVKSVLMKVLMDTCMGGVAWMLFGNSFAHGTSANGFIGHSGWALAGAQSTDFAVFFFRWTLSATSATIVSGAVAERASFYAYLTATAWLSSFVYPVVAHAVWDESGWLSAFAETPLLQSGAVDHAGCGVVHMVGAVCGLWGAVVTGPRRGRFAESGKPVPIPGHSAPLTLLGGMLLWTGWYGFNAGSGLSLAPAEPTLFGGATRQLADGTRVAVSGLATVQQTLPATTLGACGAALVGVALSYAVAEHVIDLGAVVNCLLAGLVSITAGCAVFHPYVALLVGMLGAGVYVCASRLMLRLRIDDPLDAVAIHGACGLWGLLAVGLFSPPVPHAVAGFPVGRHGLLFGGGWRLLVCQLILAAFVIVWTTATTVPLWCSLRLLGLLRVSSEGEDDGIDELLHGGSAYPMDAGVSPWHSPKVVASARGLPYGGKVPSVGSTLPRPPSAAGDGGGGGGGGGCGGGGLPAPGEQPPASPRSAEDVTSSVSPASTAPSDVGGGDRVVRFHDPAGDGSGSSSGGSAGGRPPASPHKRVGGGGGGATRTPSPASRLIMDEMAGAAAGAAAPRPAVGPSWASGRLG